MKTLKKLVTGTVVALGLTMTVGFMTEYKAQAKIKVYGPQIVEDEVEVYPEKSAIVKLTTSFVSNKNTQFVARNGKRQKVKVLWTISKIKVSNKSVAKAKAIKSFQPNWSTKYHEDTINPKGEYGLKNYAKITGKNVKGEKKCKVTITYKTKVFGKTFKRKKKVTVIVKPKSMSKTEKQYNKHIADFHMHIGDKINIAKTRGYMGTVVKYEASNNKVVFDDKGTMTAVYAGACKVKMTWDDGDVVEHTVYIEKDTVAGSKVEGLLVKRSKKSALIQWDKVEAAKEYKIYCGNTLIGTVNEKDYWNNQADLRQFVFCKYTEKNGDMVYDGPSPKAVKKMTANERKKYLMTYGCKTNYSPKSTYTIKVVATDGVNTTPEASVTSKGKTFKKKELYPHYEYMAEQNEIIKKQAELKGKKPYAMTIWDIDYERGMKLHTGRISKIQAHMVDSTEENQGIFKDHKISFGEEDLSFVEADTATGFFVHEKHGFCMELLSDLSKHQCINYLNEGVCAYTGYRNITLVNICSSPRRMGSTEVAINKNQWK